MDNQIEVWLREWLSYDIRYMSGFVWGATIKVKVKPESESETWMWKWNMILKMTLESESKSKTYQHIDVVQWFDSNCNFSKFRFNKIVRILNFFQPKNREGNETNFQPVN